MRKKALLALMLALTLLLGGCALIVKDQAVDNATEIIRMGDQVVTKEEVKEQVESVLQYNEYINSMMGQSYDVTDPQAIASAQEDAIDALKKDLALTAKAKELGLDQLTAEEEEPVATKAQEDYDSAVEYVKSNELTGAGLEGEELDKAVADYLAEREVSVEAYAESERKTIIDDKVTILTSVLLSGSVLHKADKHRSMPYPSYQNEANFAHRRYLTFPIHSCRRKNLDC